MILQAYSILCDYQAAQIWSTIKNSNTWKVLLYHKIQNNSKNWSWRSEIKKSMKLTLSILPAVAPDALTLSSTIQPCGNQSGVSPEATRLSPVDVRRLRFVSALSGARVAAFSPLELRFWADAGGLATAPSPEAWNFSPFEIGCSDSLIGVSPLEAEGSMKQPDWRSGSGGRVPVKRSVSGSAVDIGKVWSEDEMEAVVWLGLGLGLWGWEVEDSMRVLRRTETLEPLQRNNISRATL